MLRSCLELRSKALTSLSSFRISLAAAATSALNGAPATAQQELSTLAAGPSNACSNLEYRSYVNTPIRSYSSLLPLRNALSADGALEQVVLSSFAASGRLSVDTKSLPKLDEAAPFVQEWRAESVKRKRKHKMNKHKHRRRLKLNRHQRK